MTPSERSDLVSVQLNSVHQFNAKAKQSSSSLSSCANQLDLAQDEIDADLIQPEMSIKKRIDYNIEDIKSQIKTISHNYKVLIRESLGWQRLNSLKS